VAVYFFLSAKKALTLANSDRRFFRVFVVLNLDDGEMGGAVVTGDGNETSFNLVSLFITGVEGADEAATVEALLGSGAGEEGSVWDMMGPALAADVSVVSTGFGLTSTFGVALFVAGSEGVSTSKFPFSCSTTCASEGSSWVGSGLGCKTFCSPD